MGGRGHCGRIEFGPRLQTAIVGLSWPVSENAESGLEPCPPGGGTGIRKHVVRQRRITIARGRRCVRLLRKGRRSQALCGRCTGMALALVLGKLSPEATKGLLKQGLAAREEYFRSIAEPRGVKVHGYYFAEGGEWDVVVLVE